MHSRGTKSQSLAAAAVALLLLPCGAAAAPVPPGNPAATQYTEAFPTAGGQQDAENGKGGKGRQPNQVLGKRNAQQLESQGEVGKAAAALATETAPVGVAGSGAGAGEGKQGTSRGKSHSGGGSGASAESAGSGGDSALGEVGSQATGSSFSDGIDLLLPLAILGTVVWLLAYLLRRRQRPAE